MAEDAWNARDPERVALADSPDSEWRNRVEFLRGREEIKVFLPANGPRNWTTGLKETLSGFRENRILVSFESSGTTRRGSGIAPMGMNCGSSMRRASDAAAAG